MAFDLEEHAGTSSLNPKCACPGLVPASADSEELLVALVRPRLRAEMKCISLSHISTDLHEISILNFKAGDPSQILNSSKIFATT